MLPEYPDIIFGQVVEAMGIVRDKLRGTSDHSFNHVIRACWTVETFAFDIGLPDPPFYRSGEMMTNDMAVATIEDFLANRHNFGADYKGFPWRELLPVLLQLLQVLFEGK